MAAVGGEPGGEMAVPLPAVLLLLVVMDDIPRECKVDPPRRARTNSGFRDMFTRCKWRSYECTANATMTAMTHPKAVDHRPMPKGESGLKIRTKEVIKDMTVQNRFSNSWAWCHVDPSDLIKATITARTTKFKKETTGAQYKKARTTSTQNNPTIKNRSLTRLWSSINRPPSFLATTIVFLRATLTGLTRLAEAEAATARGTPLVLAPGAVLLLLAMTLAAAEIASLALAVAGGDPGPPLPPIGELVGLAPANTDLPPTKKGSRRRPVRKRRRKENGDALVEEEEEEEEDVL